LPGSWTLISRPEDLSVENLKALAPRYVFFPHWSWRVPMEIVDGFDCVCFHMTDVPYGRGGSPLQNLILRGHRNTVLSALRMVRELDAGPVYMKRPLDLAGTAQEIYQRATGIVFDMIEEITRTEPAPQPQQGTPVVFERRTPEQSELPHAGTPEQICDFIRMLDADTYPPAYLHWGKFRLEFDRAKQDGEYVIARVRIAQRGSDP